MAPAFAPADERAPALPGDVRLMNATANALFALVLIGAIGLAVQWAMRQSSFALRVIQIEGDVTRNSAATIRANAAPKLRGNFFTADLPDMRRAFESVPWVRQATVRRVWPDRLLVRLEEHKVAALWNGDAAAEKLVDAQGDVFEANVGDVIDDSLPALSGPLGSSRHVLAMFRRLAPVFARIEAQIEALTLSQRGSWHAELASGAEVELGRGTDDEIVERSERFIGTLAQVTERYQRPLEYADLRHRDGYAVRLKGITTVAPKTQQKN